MGFMELHTVCYDAYVPIDRNVCGGAENVN